MSVRIESVFKAKGKTSHNEYEAGKGRAGCNSRTHKEEEISAHVLTTLLQMAYSHFLVILTCLMKSQIEVQ